MSINVLAPCLADKLDIDNLFPLPLSTMEAFMLADARPLFPMLADMEIYLQGRIRREPFDAALAAALSRAPLFQSLVQIPRNGLPVWVRAEREIPVEWLPEGTPLGPSYDTPLDLTNELGLRVFVREGAERSSVLLHFHHACSDGMGGFAFIEDFLAAYAAATGDDSVTMRPLEPRRLLRRGDLGVEGRGIYRGFLDTLIGAREGIRFFLQRPLTLPPIQSPPLGTANRARVRSLVGTCSAQTTAGLRRAATQLNANVNDLLLRDLFLAVDQWSREHGHSAEHRQLRILMPQNLRDRDDRHMPAANMLGFAFVTRRRGICQHPQKLLQSIQAETEAVRKGQLSRYFLGGLDALYKAGLLSWVLNKNLCFASVILSNLGDPVRRFVTRFPRPDGYPQVGDLRLLEITGAPPLRPNTRAAFCVVNSMNQLRLHLRTDPYTYSADDAQQLMNQYLDRLKATADVADRIRNLSQAELF